MNQASKWSSAFRNAFAARKVRANSDVSDNSHGSAASAGAIVTNGTIVTAPVARTSGVVGAEPVPAASAGDPVGIEVGPWTADDWTAFFHERAGMVAADGLPEAEVALRAFEGCVEEWLRRQAPPARTDRCAFCGSADGERDRLVPFGTVSTGQWWVHPRCQPDWTAARHAQATEALRDMGLGAAPPADMPEHDDTGAMAAAFSATNPSAAAASSFPTREVRALVDATEAETVLAAELASSATRMDAVVISVEPSIDRVPPNSSASAPASHRRISRKTGRPPGRPRRDAPRVEARSPWRCPTRLLFYAIIETVQKRLPATFTLEQLRVYVEHPLLLAEVERMVGTGFFDVVAPQAYRLREPYRKTAARRW